MKRTRLVTVSTGFILFFLLLASQTELNSKPAQPDAGYANDPDPSGALTCATSGCHSGSPIADSTKFTVSMGLVSAGTGAQTPVVTGLTKYFADSVYYVTIAATGTAPRYGFEMTVVDAAATPGNMAGSIALLSGTTTTSLGTYQPSGSTLRQYVGHKNANTTKTWTFKWTAPSTGKGPLTFYYVGMNANGNTNETGDAVYNAVKVISEASLVNGIGNIDSKLSALSLYPTAFGGDFSVSFNMIEKGNVKAELLDMNGQLVSGLMNEEVSAGSFNQTFSAPAIAAGVYLVRVQIGDASVTKRVIKL